MIRPTSGRSATAIEMTPMIDMVFLLLAFFLVATTFHREERELQIALPQASAGVPISAALREIVVNVQEDGAVIVNGRSIELDVLSRMITDAVAANPNQKVTVRGDRATAYANVVRVLDVCKGAGVAEPYLDTVLER
ncbi:MAG: biopolymer transporter ExbD [Planctomycetota bacterium]|nr:biopolymer transporter ExbD [Planctomycetota bacterium]